jgi:hypothetical protein
MNDHFKKFERFLVPVILLSVVIVDFIMVFLSEGTHGGADDVNHYQLARYSFQHPEFFLDQWGKPFFTALMSPFAQLGFNGVRIFNVLAGTATAYFTYRMARMFKISMPVITIFLLISSPLYAVLMISGMTEILFSLVLILSIFLFFRKNYIWSAILLSFIPFVRTEGVVIIPLFILALAWVKQWKAIPFLFLGFVFYSLVGSFYFDDLLWIVHKMPYSGNAKDIYGSGELLHYVRASKYIFGIPLALMIILGLLAWVTDPLVNRERKRKEWLLEMLVGYLPFFTYFAAHSYVWWKGMGNSVGMIRVIVAVLPSAVLLAAMGWSRILDLIPVNRVIKYVSTGILAVFLLTIPYKMYRIPVPLEGTQRIVKNASDWMLQSEYTGIKVFYFNPFFPHFLKTNPYDSNQNAWFVPDREHPEKSVKEGEIVIWDAHFGPNEGGLALENLFDNPGFRLIHLTREHEPFIVLGGYTYEIYFFQRVAEEGEVDNTVIYESMMEDILHMGLKPYQSSDHLY